MLKNFLMTVVGTIFASSAATSSAQGVSFSEFDDVVGDVGSRLGTAEVIQGSPDQSLDLIGGLLSRNTFGLYDADLYKIYLTGGGNFSATVTGVLPQVVNTPVSQAVDLFLFDSAGNGIYGYGSTLPANNPLTPQAPGEYFLGITQKGLAPSFRPARGMFREDFMSREDFIFPVNVGLVGPSQNVGSLYDFEPGSFREALDKPFVVYRINLTGTTPVPEPSDSLGLLAIGILGGLAKLKADKKRLQDVSKLP